ncbi:DUF3604 domain-containing protein [Pontixanthobacter aestiaquae]|uniref:DUF3604 domain-containing protein n=1 Tax=Pontixanthobacter aestiaquae TaxID=1509367 RepID=A0A844Z130_9SPHN|nr:DUF3604 domain-containing protein [Pontixanthobacter aestiaquae]MDN3646584.1 DUF3604 domain-containing protein [Pontixanthobacter aestiaquae]MXO82431.1 DUF3604 domain-containing protein [Pontixanthobacter aestiaquae]
MKKILGIVVLVAVLAAAIWWLFIRHDPVAKAEDVAEAEAAVTIADYPQQVLWGDTHLHTDNSIDAFGFGTRLGPDAALKFARGEKVTATMGMEAQLARPLDFLVIADHSDGLGATRRLYDAPRFMIQDDTLLRWHDMMQESPEQSQLAIAELITAASNGTLPDALRDPENQAENTRNIWQAHLATLDKYYEPGKFTPLAGYEWTLMPGGNNLHRVVMYRDGYDRTSQILPAPALDGNITALFDHMDAYEQSTGGKVLAIPHNSNLSNGLMFELTQADGGPMTAETARRRALREPVVEATQIKGDSESHPFLSPNDEFAGFGDVGWEIGNLSLTAFKEDDQLAGEYLREALKRGLSIEQQTGANPYKFGMIGSTDSHTTLATGDEDNFFGKHTGNEPNGERANAEQNLGTRVGRFGWNYLAGGYAAVWAKANTRAEIFDAMMRREVYATTGPRMTVRFFGGFDLGETDFAGDWVADAYKGGVPMGGELSDEGKAPQFIVSALKDPDGAHLDRVQIVKGWITADGTTREKVFDVVWSDMDTRRSVGGKLPAVGNTVNREEATYTNDIGAPQLQTVWTDPEYRAGQNAFYYVRVLEIPTPRWTLFDAVRFGIELSEEAQKYAVAQERAYTSPIWIGPAPAAP